MIRRETILIVIVALFAACASSPDPPRNVGAETLVWARHMMEIGKARAAAEELEKLVLNFPDLQYSDEAQFLLGEAHLSLKEYILAESAFRLLSASYPGSDYRDDAEFGIARCLALQAPKFQLDQSSTHAAVRAFERFIEDHPDSPLIPSAEKELKTCRNRLSLKLLEAARHYYRRGRCGSAKVYLDEILREYLETDSAFEARFLLAQCQRRNGELKDAARSYAELLGDLNDGDPLRDTVADRLAEVRRELAGG